ncbi:MAG TPA: sugar phosphate isomerase/epimerase family protein [Chloroflexota bacterium]|nr:sugar phosphate isomerase/epimerase family protein [Chloroflexota bacterium]
MMAVSDVGVFLNTTALADVAEACRAVRGLGFREIQLGKLADEYHSPPGRRRLKEIVDGEGLRAVALSIVHEGGSYATLDAVRRTVGFLPAETVEARVQFSFRCMDTVAALGIPLVTTHVGLLPADPDDEGYQRVRRAVERVARYAARIGVTYSIETGQETAEELLAFIARVDAPVAVNFDGPNFIAYQTQDPIEALRALYPQTAGVHIKDYLVPEAPGLLSKACRLGEGAGKVDETLHFLLEKGYDGPLILETYDRVNPMETLAFSRAYVLERLKARVPAPA